uniref:Nad1 n=1 Tax=Calcarina hispida TaxID=203399 RepID=UPI0023F519E9|nr:Nad1 [Calcarina hispida]WEF49990.1 Nad1 [Calcarina hispida]
MISLLSLNHLIIIPKSSRIIIYPLFKSYTYLLIIYPLYIIPYLIIYPLSIIALLTLLINYLFLIYFFVSIPADSNRVPYDLPEAESELVAGFITEYSTIYFSLILLTEYANIIALTYLIILILSIYPFPLTFLLYLISLIRSTLNRLKFDDLMTSAWLVILPIIFSFLLLSILLIISCSMSILYDSLSFIHSLSIYLLLILHYSRSNSFNLTLLQLYPLNYLSLFISLALIIIN